LQFQQSKIRIYDSKIDRRISKSHFFKSKNIPLEIEYKTVRPKYSSKEYNDWVFV